MDLGRILRSAGLVVVLALSSFGAYRVALGLDTDEVSTSPRLYEQAPTTPMLSPRRIPQTLQAPIIDERIGPVVEQITEVSPTATCIRVQLGDRVMEPSLNPTVGLVPASNQKLLTTYTALGVLGPDFVFETTVRATGPATDGTLDGNLYLVGDGDPFLSTADWWTQYEHTSGRANTRLEALADDVAAQFSTISGDIVGDESLYDDLRQGPWAERLVAQKQSGPLSALSVNEGFVDWPETDTGVARLRSETSNPPLHAASVFRRLLAERGVTVEGATTADVAPPGARTVATVESPPLTAIVTHINSYSSNFGAELVLKRIGKEVADEGSTAAGAAAMLEFLRTDGLPVAGLVVEDGSGLAETNRLTCPAVSALLTRAGPDSDLGRSLAIGAERGSLLLRFVDSPAAEAVYAKTGTLQGSSALAGFVRSSGEDEFWLTFAYIANEEFIDGPGVRDVQDQLVVGLTDYGRAPTIRQLSPTEPEDTGVDASAAETASPGDDGGS